VTSLWQSTVGTKALVAISGLALWLWVVLHVAGNLTMFSGPAAADGYAASLHRAPGWLWAARAGLAAAALVHVAGIASLARASRRARPRFGVATAYGLSALPARGMRIGGVLLLAFIGYHLLHLSFGVLHPHFRPGRVYDNVIVGLRSGWVASVYVLAAVLVGLHLVHGLWAVTRTLGLRPAAAATRHRPAVLAVSTAITLGFASIPIAVLMGWLR